MADRGRPKAELVLTEDERQTLERWARRPSSSQALAQRCRIVLGCAAGKPNKQVAAEVGVWPQTVGDSILVDVTRTLGSDTTVDGDATPKSFVLTPGAREKR